MKGIIFTEFLEMVEQEFGYEMVDKIISENDLSSGGAYTNVGTYNHEEIVKLIISLSRHSRQEVSSLLKAFGIFLFDTLKNAYPHFLEAAQNAFDFLESIENYIHVEVRKLYPDAELPSFETRKLDSNTLELIYKSERKMADFAEGLLIRSLDHFGVKASINRTNLDQTGSKVKFLITRI